MQRGRDVRDHVHICSVALSRTRTIAEDRGRQSKNQLLQVAQRPRAATLRAFHWQSGLCRPFSVEHSSDADTVGGPTYGAEPSTIKD